MVPVFLGLIEVVEGVMSMAEAVVGAGLLDLAAALGGLFVGLAVVGKGGEGFPLARTVSPSQFSASAWPAGSPIARERPRACWW
jgi:hypothetical protein